MAKKTQASLMENKYVKELLAIMEENRVDSKDLRDLLGYVGAMERQLDAAVTELQGMRYELNGMREERDHPAATLLRNAVRSLEGTVNDARERLDAIKTGIIEGCKKAVDAFKEKGIGALNNIAGFFHIKSGFAALRDSLGTGMENALEAPLRSELSCLSGTKKLAEAAIGKLEKLEQSAEKPSVLENMKILKEQTARTKREAPAAEKQKRTEPDL